MTKDLPLHPSPEGGTTLTKDHPAILRIYDVGIWDSPHSKFEPILLGCFGEKNCFCVFWPFLVFLGVIFTQPCCFRVFLALHMTSTHPRHLPDTLRHHLMAKMQAPWQTRDDCWQHFFCFFSSSAPFLNSMFFIINFEN